jgi:hypothetical protein
MRRTRVRCAEDARNDWWSIASSEVSISVDGFALILMKLPVLILLLHAVHAALPPGYEEELYCPEDMCLKAKKMPDGWCDARSAFHECCNERDGSKMHPRPWGNRVEMKVKTDLIAAKWHRGECAKQHGVCGASRMKLTAMADMLVHRVEGLLQSRLSS